MFFISVVHLSQPNKKGSGRYGIGSNKDSGRNSMLGLNEIGDIHCRHSKGGPVQMNFFVHLRGRSVRSEQATSNNRKGRCLASDKLADRRDEQLKLICRRVGT